MESNEDWSMEEVEDPKKRYFMLALFMALSASNSFQWIEYAVIAHTIVKFYNVSYASVDWTSVVYMVAYILFVIPASWFLNKFGLRKSLLIGAAGNCIGAIIKFTSTHPHLFWISFLGQTIVGLSQVFLLGVPPRLAAIWFDSNQLSTACAAGVFGNQFGIALGFLIPPLIVHSSTADTIKKGLHKLFMISAIANTVIFILIFIFFAEKPPLTKAVSVRSNRREDRSDSYLSSLKEVAKNSNFVLLFFTYGINVGVFYALSTFLSQIILFYYPDEQTSAGTIGLLIVVVGMFGSVIGGLALDKFHFYKLTTVTVYAFSLLGIVLFTTFLLFAPISFIFIIAAFLGFFMTGYLPIGFEFGVELTFPITESTTSGLLNLSAQLFGTSIILIVGQIIRKTGVLVCNIVLSLILLLGLVLTVLIKSDLRRQKAQKGDSYEKNHVEE